MTPLHASMLYEQVATEADMTAAAAAALKGVSVVLSGATGPASGNINGVFAPTGKDHNGKPLFQKVGDPDKWLCYAKDGDWGVSSTANKDANICVGWRYSAEKGLPHPTMATGWKFIKDGKFVAESGMSAKVSPL